MEQVELNARPRTETGRNKVKHLRRKGLVPGVVYGAHREAQSIELSALELGNLIHKAHSENVLVELKLDDKGDGRLALLQGVQHDPLTQQILHVDFHELRADEQFTVDVPVEALGEPVGVRVGGGVLEYVSRQVRVRCLPKDLPNRITVDVANLEIGQNIHVGDLRPPAGVELLDDPSTSLLAVVAPTVAEEPVAAEGEAKLTEPEVIKEKKPEEGEEKAEAEKAEKAPAKGEAKAGGKTEGKSETKAEAKKK